jgi:raffinose/stachyose/melibiose transport system permease protein
MQARRIAELPQTAGKVFLALFCVSIILALAWIALTSFKSNAELFASVWSLPSGLEFDNYVNAWTLGGMGVAFANSILVAFGASIGVVALAAPASYVLSRTEFRGREALVNGIAAGMGVPAVLLFIPVYLLLSGFGAVNSLQGLLVVYLGVQMPFTVFLLTGFFATLPVELEEAAIVDGASEWTVFLRVMLPLARPGLLTAVIFNLIYLWKEFFWGLVLLRSQDRFTLGVALNSLREGMSFNADWVGLFAAVVILVAPAILIYAMLSRRVLRAVRFGVDT